MVIWDQSKKISPLQKSKICKLNVYYSFHKNGNKTSVQPILQSNSTSFMFNNIFCKMNIKKLSTGGGGGGAG